MIDKENNFKNENGSIKEFFLQVFSLSNFKLEAAIVIKILRYINSVQADISFIIKLNKTVCQQAMFVLVDILFSFPYLGISLLKYLMW